MFMPWNSLRALARHASNNSLQYFKCLLLFCSVAPLLSIYIVYFDLLDSDVNSRHGGSGSSITHDGTNSGNELFIFKRGGESVSITMSMLGAMLKEANSTMDELWSSAAPPLESLVGQMYSLSTTLPSGMYYYSTPAFSFSFDLNSFTAHHWAIVIPWMISIFFGLVFPALLSVMSFVEDRHHRHRVNQHRRSHPPQNNSDDNNNGNNDEEYNTDDSIYDYEYYDSDRELSYFDYFSFLFPLSKERQRLIELCVSTKSYTKILTEDDLVREHHGSKVLCDDDDATSTWRIPSPGVPLPRAKTTLAAAATAAVAAATDTDDITNTTASPSSLIITKPVTIFTAAATTTNTPAPATMDSSSASAGKAETSFHNNNKRDVVGLCAICLNPFSVGDQIIWSSNPDCVHCFHKQCIFSWFLKGKKIPKKQQCPCCRQSFVSKSKSQCR